MELHGETYDRDTHPHGYGHITYLNLPREIRMAICGTLTPSPF
jgi:hypothetical protein